MRITPEEDKLRIRILVEVIKRERALVRAFISEYNELRNANMNDLRLSGLSHAINLHKLEIDKLQSEIDDINAANGYRREKKPYVQKM